MYGFNRLYRIKYLPAPPRRLHAGARIVVGAFPHVDLARTERCVPIVNSLFPFAKLLIEQVSIDKFPCVKSPVEKTFFVAYLKSVEEPYYRLGTHPPFAVFVVFAAFPVELVEKTSVVLQPFGSGIDDARASLFD